MLIDLNFLIRKYNLNIKGVLHVGAHFGQEYETYKKLGIKNLIFFEPLDTNFMELVKNVPGDKVKLLNIALGNYTGTANLNLEVANQGMSCSILQPALHLQYYPNIVFNGMKQVSIDKLDNIQYDRKFFNMINIDVQGYELEVFKGAIKSLKYIDYIYTEVNVATLYQDCALMEQLDEFLEDFERVETMLVPEKWGDALYIRKRKAKSSLKKCQDYVNVPEEFKPRINVAYPPNNDILFEEWFDVFYKDRIDTKRIYLPVYWTSYFNNNNANKKSVNDIQKYINRLPTKNKYFTIIQYDDGPLVDFKNLDIVAFSMGGGKAEGKNAKTVPIPLIATDNKKLRFMPKEYYCNFIGSFVTHSCRNQIKALFSKNPRFFISGLIPYDLYCEYMAKSTFVLCPRGYGLTSFRIWEALYFNAIPVYISDKFWIPFNAPFDYGIKISISEIKDIENKIDKVYHSDQFSKILTAGKKVLDEYFNYQGLSEKIIKYIKSLEPVKRTIIKSGKRKTTVKRKIAKESAKVVINGK